jgi:hypothetical protein
MSCGRKVYDFSKIIQITIDSALREGIKITLKTQIINLYKIGG